MTLKDVLLQHEDLHGIAKDTDSKVCELILAFREKIGPASQCLPPNIYSAWFGRDGEFARIGKLLLTDYCLQAKPGFKLTDSFLTSSARSYKLEDFIFENFNFKVHFGSDNHQTLSYSKDKFFQLAQCAVAMVLTKYGAKSLTQAHIYCQTVTVLFRYFKIYSSDDYAWLINLTDI